VQLFRRVRVSCEKHLLASCPSVRMASTGRISMKFHIEDFYKKKKVSRKSKFESNGTKTCVRFIVAGDINWP
jgi:hypothetical protein